MITRLASFLQIRSGEERLVARLAGLFALVEAGRGIGANAADALFFLRFGVENLPFMFMMLGASNFLVSLTYAAGLGRVRRQRFFVAILATLAAVLLIERAAIFLEVPRHSPAGALYPLLWISVNIIGSVLGLLSWNIAGEVCDARQAKRLFSLFVSAGILGGVIGNCVTGPLARGLGADNLLVVYAAILAVLLGLTRDIARRFIRPAPASGSRESFVEQVRAGFDFVRRSPLLKLMAVASVLFSILYFSIAFPFSKAVSAAFPAEAEIAGFLGLFSGSVTAITFFVSLFVANRLYARVGVVNAVFVFPLAYLAGFVLLATGSSLTRAVIARGVQLVILGGIAGTAYSTFFNVVPSEKRGQVRSFDSGVPEQIGVALSGVLLIVGERALTTTQIFAMGIVASIVCAMLVWRMRRAYADALVAALRAGRYEVFTAGERAFAGFRGDANAIRIACTVLNDPKPGMRRLAAQMLARTHATSSAPWLIKAMHDPDPEVRAAIVDALHALDCREAAGDLAALLDDGDAAVRARVLRALPGLQPQATPAVLASIETLLGDPDLQVRAQAAVAMAHYGEAPRALPALNALLRDPAPGVRCRALGALGEIATRAPASFDIGPVVGALRDPSVAVRRAACQTLGLARSEAAIEPLAGSLSDSDASVRGAAAEALKSMGAPATARVLEVLHREESAALDAALDALAPGDPAVAGPLHAYAHRELDRARVWRSLAASIPQAGRVTKFLRETLEIRASDSGQRLVKVVGLAGRRDAMTWVARSLKSRDAETRAAAVEALETLGDKHLAREIVSLLDAAPGASGMSADAALDILLAHREAWLRALAACAVAETRARGLASHLQSLAADPEPLVRESARIAATHLNEDTSMETLQTVSVLERIMLLREVPLFADLSPDDLKQIADVTREHVYSDGALMCREGEEGNEMFILASGQVRVFKRAEGGDKMLATRAAGDFIGEMSIVESAPRSASVRAEGSVRVLALDGDAFKAILRDRPEVALAVLRGLSRRLRERE